MVAMRLRSMLSLKDSSLGPMMARISSSSREWLSAESRLPADALRRDEESSGERLRSETRSRLVARAPVSASRSSWWSCWARVRLLGGRGGGVVPDELLSSDRQRVLKGRTEA
jgi:hypothetical protein